MLAAGAQMKLFYQTHSPHARKVLVMAHEVGLADRIEVIHQETSPMVRNDAVFAQNPLGKVPVLVLSDVGDRHPRLGAWFEAFSHRPSMARTPLSGQTHDQ
jgi:glutathione S-transferase